jgi:hypothetical protein
MMRAAIHQTLNLVLELFLVKTTPPSTRIYLNPIHTYLE